MHFIVLPLMSYTKKTGGLKEFYYTKEDLKSLNLINFKKSKNEKNTKPNN